MREADTHPGVAQPPDRLLTTLQHLLALPATDFTMTANAAAQLLAEALHADKIDVFLYQPASDTLEAMGTSDTPMGRRQHALGLNRLPVSNGGRTVDVYCARTPYHDGHVDQDVGELVGIREGLGVCSAIAVPLAIGGEHWGVLMASSAQPEQFTERDLGFLQAVSHWVGMVAQRAKLVEQIARQAAERGRQMAAEELMTVLAHDLRNHLTPLRAHLDRIARAARQERPERLFASIEAASFSLERLQGLIADLLDGVRLEEGLFVLAPHTVDLTVLVRETVLAFESIATIEVQASVDVTVQADSNRLRQALENLVTNAITYSPPGQPVLVVLSTEERQDSRWALISVTDRGPGIAPEVMPRLFQRFAAGTGSTGLGLGLYLASRIAEAHGGSLTVSSTLGQGACFTLALPI